MDFPNICFYCGKSGHVQKECRKKARDAMATTASSKLTARVHQVEAESSANLVEAGNSSEPLFFMAVESGVATATASSSDNSRDA